MFSSPPDVSPEDIWGDPACLVSEGQGPAAFLPPKRAREDKAVASNTAAHGDGGLRIGTRSSGDPAARTITRLEVQQINGEVVRLRTEEPEVERMPRHVVFHEKPASVNEGEVIEETREWGKSKKQPVFWFLLTGGATASLVVVAILALPRINKSNATRPGEDASEWVVETVADGDAMAAMLSRKAEAGRVLRDVLAAPSAEAMLPLVRDSGEVSALIKADRRMPKLAPDFPPLAIDSWSARENQSLTYGVLSGTLPDYSGFETYFTVSEGRLVLDWKASTAYGTADFSQLMRKQGNPEEIRGWIESAGFYTLAFSENNYQAYQLASPDKQQLIWAYARWGSPAHQALKALLKGGYILEGQSEAQKVTVRLKPGPDDSLPGQWEIVELLHKEWIAP